MMKRVRGRESEADAGGEAKRVLQVSGSHPAATLQKPSNSPSSPRRLPELQ